jgi:acyl transferase domain-containing protein
VGSVKTNLGHLESAAGIASFLKVVLALRHGEIPPSLHFEEPNPYIPWDGSALEVATRRTPWPCGPAREKGPRRAGVSAFGMSGTNVHVVLEEAPERPAPSSAAQADRPVHLLVLSARDETALRDLARATADRLRDEPGLAAGDVCHTAGAGRARFPVRLAVPGGSTGELEAELRGWLAGPPAAGAPPARTGKIAFLFSGQGSELPGMGQELCATEPVVRRVLERCDEVLRPLLGAPLPELLGPGTTDIAQPALFAVQCALVELWRAGASSPPRSWATAWASTRRPMRRACSAWRTACAWWPGADA